ncbi:helix-turn-helix domain-containing protein [Coprococcus sp. AF51-11b1]|uniref:helix-turn-helix domain-containing protein n=1 Tax=Coprococcus sp. AF51-11b1 TaxID=2997947 RepID=UPI000E545860|nr:helix-turn-helix domain-containing protein [Coprococcus sp. AF51-11b1]RHQ78249.1 helix-turn-helix domain-containing protein [Blautia sp. AF22-5LB]
MDKRIKELRKALNLTQNELGSRIGMTPNTITNYETGRRVPSNQVIFSICREFNVNEDWLRTGNGDMFNPISEDEELDLYVGRISGGADEFKKNLIKTLCKLSEDEWDVLKKIISEMK